MAESIWARAARNAVAGWCMGCYASNKLSVNAKNMKGEHGFITSCITLDKHFRHKYHGTFTQSPARQSSARVGRRHTLVTARVARRHTHSCSASCCQSHVPSLVSRVPASAFACTIGCVHLHAMPLSPAKCVILVIHSRHTGRDNVRHAFQPAAIYFC
jgi:hypothetical protein